MPKKHKSVNDVIEIFRENKGNRNRRQLLESNHMGLEDHDAFNDDEARQFKRYKDPSNSLLTTPDWNEVEEIPDLNSTYLFAVIFFLLILSIIIFILIYLRNR